MTESQQFAQHIKLPPIQPIIQNAAENNSTHQDS